MSFLKEPDFLKVEGNCALLTVDRGFLAAQKAADEFAEFFNTCQSWVELCGISADTVEEQTGLLQTQIDEWGDKEFERILIRDAERAFLDQKHRDLMMHILTIMTARFGDYHQGMGLAAAFMLLSLTGGEVLALLDTMSREDKYIPTVWRAESVACATDAYVLRELLGKQFKAQQDHLDSNFVLPETFVQKWICALSVHVLPFKNLTQFFTQFCQHGHLFLFRFGLSLISVMQEELLKQQTQANIYEILRLDFHNKAVTEDKCDLILNADSLAAFDELTAELANTLPAKREEMYNKHLKARMESAKLAHASEEKDKAPSTMCEFCTEVEGDNYCLDCKKYICDDCRDSDATKEAGEHDEDSHNCCPAEDREFAEAEANEE